MATKRRRTTTTKVKNLKAKSLSAGKAKRVRGGSFSLTRISREGASQKIAPRGSGIVIS